LLHSVVSYYLSGFLFLVSQVSPTITIMGKKSGCFADHSSGG
jgi:hypothetical protein